MSSISFSRCVLVVSVYAFFFSVASEGHWAKEDEAAGQIDEVITSVKVNSDYSIELLSETTATVKKQTAVEDFAIVEVPYSPTLESVKILSARSISGGVTYNVDPRVVQDTEVRGEARGYDSVRELRFSLPQIGVGSKVSFKDWKKILAHPFPGFISFDVPFGDKYPVKSYRFEMSSAIPIAYRSNPLMK